MELNPIPLPDEEVTLEDGPIDEGEEFSTEADVDEIVIEDVELSYSDDDVNLVHAFEMSDEGLDALSRIAELVTQNFDWDWDSSEEYRERAAADFRIFSGDLDEKEYPYENCANPNVPIMLENLSRLHARLMGETFGDGKNIAGYIPTGPENKEEAENLSLHLNWQLRTQIADFMRQMDRAVLAQLIHGDVTCRSYYDPDTRTNRHDTLTVDQFVTPYAVVTTQPDYSDIDHHTLIMHLSKTEMERRAGEWAGIDRVLGGGDPSWDEDPAADFAEQVNKSAGIEVPDSPGPHRVLEYEGWIKLPLQAKHRWCKVVMHYATKHIFKLMIHEEEDWREQVRFEEQQMSMQAYHQQKQAYDDQLAQRDLDAGMFEEMASAPQLVGPEFREGAMAQANAIPYPIAPERPEWMEDDLGKPAAPRMVPVRLYSHGVGLENLAGSHGLPVGRIQADFNRTANTLLSQFLDASTLANCWGLITTDNVEFPQPFSWEPGTVTKVTGVQPAELNNSIKELKPGPASPQLMEGVDLTVKLAQSSVQSPDVLSGEPGKSGETFRGISSRIEQASKQLSVYGRKFADTFLRQVLRNNAKLNALYLDDLEVVRITDWKQNVQRDVAIGRDMYRRNYGVEIRSDLRFTSEQQKVSEAESMLQLVTGIPILQANVALAYAATKAVFEAHKRYDLIPLMGPEPEKPTTPLGLPMGDPNAPPAEPPPQ